MHPIKSSSLMTNRTLRAERHRQAWTRDKVAKALGVTTKTVMRWENGQNVPHPHHQDQLGILFGKTAEELGLLRKVDKNKAINTVEQEQLSLVQQATPDVPVQASLIDPTMPKIQSTGGSLLGRAGLLMQIKKRLLDTNRQKTFIALSGQPGIGKTSLAVALATDQEVQARFRDGILWAPLGPHPHVLGQLTRWGRLHRAESDRRPQQRYDAKSLRGLHEANA